MYRPNPKYLSIILSSTAFILSACGGGSGSKPAPAATVTKRVIGSPQTNPRVDKGCAPAEQKLSIQQVYLWQDGGINPYVRDLTSLALTPTLTGRGVDEVIIGGEELSLERVTFRANGEPDIQKSSKVIKRETPLTLCDPQRSYPSDSVEGVGLSSLYLLESAHDFYQTLSTSKAELPAAKLMILPRYQQVVEINAGNLPPAAVQELSRSLGIRLPARIEGHLVDNAAYGRIDDQPYFLVFPKSQEFSTQLFGQQTLWNSPFVMAHEFAHHVFYHHVPAWVQGLRTGEDDGSHHIRSMPRLSAESLTKRTKEKTAPKPLAVAATRFSQVGPVAVPAGGSTGPFQAHEIEQAVRMVSAVNEAFADLFGYYATGAQAGYAKNMGCFEQNREVSSPNFKSSLPKKLGVGELVAGIVGKVDASPFLPPTGDLCTLDWEDSHIIGAVLANTLDQMISLQIGNGDNQPRADIKASFLLNWLEQYFRELPARKMAFDAETGGSFGSPYHPQFETVAFMLLHFMQVSFDTLQSPEDAKLNSSLEETLKKAFPFAKSYCDAKKSKCSVFPITMKLDVNQ